VLVLGLILGGAFDFVFSQSIEPLYVLSSPGEQYFQTSVLSPTYGNITVEATFVTSNLAGLSAENAVTMQVYLRTNVSILDLPRFQNLLIDPTQAYPIVDRIPVEEVASFPLESTDGKGYQWYGSETLTFFSYGTLPLNIIFEFTPPGRIATPQGPWEIGTVSTPAFIQVEPPIVTLEYFTDVILVILEATVIILIAYEILHNRAYYDHYRVQETEA
jgi:hypothetical protein